MALSTSPLAYAQCYEVLDQALNDPSGARLPVRTYQDGEYLRARLHQARAIDRKSSEKAYKPGDALYGQSIYDKLVVRIKDLEGQVYVYVEQVDNQMPEVELLSQVEAAEVTDQPELELEEPTTGAITRRI